MKSEAMLFIDSYYSFHGKVAVIKVADAFSKSYKKISASNFEMRFFF